MYAASPTSQTKHTDELVGRRSICKRQCRTGERPHSVAHRSQARRSWHLMRAKEVKVGMGGITIIFSLRLPTNTRTKGIHLTYRYDPSRCENKGERLLEAHHKAALVPRKKRKERKERKERYIRNLEFDTAHGNLVVVQEIRFFEVTRIFRGYFSRLILIISDPITK